MNTMTWFIIIIKLENVIAIFKWYFEYSVFHDHLGWWEFIYSAVGQFFREVHFSFLGKHRKNWPAWINTAVYQFPSHLRSYTYVNLVQTIYKCTQNSECIVWLFCADFNKVWNLKRLLTIHQLNVLLFQADERLCYVGTLIHSPGEQTRLFTRAQRLNSTVWTMNRQLQSVRGCNEPN